jgi:S-adenosylmethionine synthetase
VDLHNPDDESNQYTGEENVEKPARDLGLVFGYATDETEECMPLTIMLSHQLNAKLAELRRNEELPWARPDTKTQVKCFIFSFTGSLQMQNCGPC